MRKVFLISCLVTFWCLMSVDVKAIPAYPRPIEFIQPDGSKITILIKGDERLHWRETTDSYTLMFNKDGYLTYAVKDSNGDLQPSDIVAKNVNERDLKTNSFLSKIEKNLYYSKEQISVLMQVLEVREGVKSQQRANSALIGSYNALCVLVQFPNKSMVKTASDFEGLMNEIGYSENGSFGSVKDFFLESSYGQFDLNVTLVGPYTAPENESYYAGGDGTSRCNVLARWLAQEADEDVDYSTLDSDNDGVVDNFHFIFAGYGQEAGGGAGTIWSHSWAFNTLTLDGKTLSTYSCSPELKGGSGTVITDIGVIGHEMSHAFGSPDYYDVDYATGGQYEGTGNWDMMAGGSWNNDGNCPSHHNMYQKIQYGWVTPITLDSETDITMPTSTENPVAYIVNTNTAREYFLLENRQKMKFDTYLPGHGLLIYRVHKDIAANRSRINTTHPQRLYPVCASSTVAVPDSKKSSYGSINSSGCPFPGSKNKVQFTDETTPSMLSWAKEDTGKPITNIVETDGVISFSFMSNSPTKFAITISEPENGKIVVKNGDEEIESGITVTSGTELTIETTPENGFTLTSVTANGNIIINNKVTITENTTITALFESITGINNPTIDKINVWAKNDGIVIKNLSGADINIAVFDILGQTIYSNTTNDMEQVINISKSGTFIVRISNDNNVNTYKVIIKK